ncbi:sodium-dependent transporter [Zhongshania sp.]|jgi:NSS family neurotransmitter:Na+ symporter|uniref:sodium-dependent transporter n=1 Tax=Zhongshania sp. TaxID=1971902 RepID=UPI001B59D5C8|nr:sodium-dependent transporter [Zhongshania sp.]MBQ0796874.1 sodium-dependent transporter [Zhongshania sp.]
MALKKRKIQGIWSSRWTFLAAATGLVVSLGNFWRTPQELGQNGGGAYLIAYVACLFFIMLPIAVAEVRIAVRARGNPVHAIDQLAHYAKASKHWSLVTQIASIAALLLAANYSIVSGWLLAYVAKMATGVMDAASLDLVAGEFQDLLAAPDVMSFWQRIFLVLAIALSALNVVRGMAAVLRVLLPVMLLVLLGLLYYGYALGDFQSALSWMFELRVEDLSWRGGFSALQHAFYTLSIGTGALMAYGAYFPSGRSVTRQLIALAVFDTAVLIIAGVAILALVFDQHIVSGSGPALLFISLPFSFGNLVFGDIAGTAFYVLLFILALTTVVALMEPVVAYLVERWGLMRWSAALLVGGLVFLVGDLSISSMQASSGMRWLSRSLMEWLDILAANVLLPLTAWCFVLFAGWRVPKRVYGVRDGWFEGVFFWLWQALLRYIAPPAVLTVLVVGLYLRVTS